MNLPILWVLFGDQTRETFRLFKHIIQKEWQRHNPQKLRKLKPKWETQPQIHIVPIFTDHIGLHRQLEKHKLTSPNLKIGNATHDFVEVAFVFGEVPGVVGIFRLARHQGNFRVIPVASAIVGEDVVIFRVQSVLFCTQPSLFFG